MANSKLENEFKQIILDTLKNTDRIYDVGDRVQYYHYIMDYSLNSINSTGTNRAVIAEIIVAKPDNMYDIKIEETGAVEKDFSGEYLFLVE